MRIAIEALNKSFGKLQVLKDLSIEVEDRSFTTLLGPSGSGKTTLLRIIAGLEYQDSGNVVFGGKIMNDIHPNKRNIGFVFQNYMLWPSMKVKDNIAFGLRMRKTRKREISERVEEIMSIVGLPGLENRYPKQLSGGQQQRVGLARALVYHPETLLLDEPLSNLDAALREKMRFDILKIQRETGITAVYVTHDQEEAMAISDKIALLMGGRILQTGSPQQMYNSPVSLHVGIFLGKLNKIPVQLVHDGSKMELVMETGLRLPFMREDPQLEEGHYLLCFRPEKASILVQQTEDVFCMDAVVAGISFLGDKIMYRLMIGNIEVEVSALSLITGIETGTPVCLKIDDINSCLIFPIDKKQY